MSEVFELGSTTIRVVAATDVATVLDGVLEPGGGSAWHTHTREDETIVVVEGALVVNDGERRTLEAGEAHVLPRGRRHAFANESDVPSRVLFVCTPGGLERFFRDVVAASDDAEIAAAAERAGLVFG